MVEGVILPSKPFSPRLLVAMTLVFLLILLYFCYFPPVQDQTKTSSGEARLDDNWQLQVNVFYDGFQRTPLPSVELQLNSKTTREARYGYYRVENGDSLYWIASTYDTSISFLRDLNNLQSDVIRPGQVLKVPYSTLKEYPVGVKLTDAEVKWLAQMIHGEARGEPYQGQVAVGAVIINRLKSSEFPNTLRGVLFEPRAFQPIQNGAFFNEPNQSARRAALEALNGADPTNGALYFFNPSLSTDRFMHARPAVITIGEHRFMY